MRSALYAQFKGIDEGMAGRVTEIFFKYWVDGFRCYFFATDSTLIPFGRSAGYFGKLKYVTIQ